MGKPTARRLENLETPVFVGA
ncbi:MAG: hypothetical protein RL653_1171, partial [Pseudomonadota bacterium]